MEEKGIVIRVARWLYTYKYLVRGAAFSYVGWYGILFVSGYMDNNNIFFEIVKLTLLTLFTVFFAYGVISFIQDIKKGGIAHVINKLKDGDF